jgi:outer membrane protein
VVRNQGLLTQRLERRRLEVRTRAAWASWSPELFLDTHYQRPYFDNDFAGGVGDDRVGYAVGTSWRNIIGTRLEAAVGVEQGIAAGVPTQPTLSVAIEQPLLKDGWLTGAGLPLTEAQLTSGIQGELFRDELNAFIVDVDAAYWDLALAQADLDIKTRSQARAQAQFDDTAENIRRGILAEAEIYVVEETLVFFQSEHLRARQRLRLAQQALDQLLYRSDDAVTVAADGLDAGAEAVPARDEAVAAALAGNPRLKAQRLRVALAHERLRFAANQTLPSLSLRTSVGVHGEAVDYGAAWGDLVAKPGVDAEVGVRLAVPLDRDSIDAGYEGAALDAEREEAELLRQENQLRFAVDNALSTLATDLALAESARRQVGLAELKLQAQMDKYQSGLSTLSDVVRFQRELDDAAIQAKRVVREVRVGRTRLLQQLGSLHDDVGVGLQDPAERR